MAIEKWPYTNLHDLNLDWILGEVKDMHDIVKDINPADIAALREEMRIFEEQYPALDLNNFGDMDANYWVDGLNSVNGTGSEDSPYNNLQSALDNIKRGQNEIRITFLRGGTYTLNEAVFNGVTVHFSVGQSVTSNIIIDFQQQEWLVFNSHFNITGNDNCTFIFRNYDNRSTFHHFENSAMLFQYCSFQHPVQMIGGNLSPYKCTFNGPVTLTSGCASNINACTFASLDGENPALKIDIGSHAYLHHSTFVNNPAGSTTSMIAVYATSGLIFGIQNTYTSGYLRMLDVNAANVWFRSVADYEAVSSIRNTAGSIHVADGYNTDKGIIYPIEEPFNILGESQVFLLGCKVSSNERTVQYRATLPGGAVWYGYRTKVITGLNVAIYSIPGNQSLMAKTAFDAGAYTASLLVNGASAITLRIDFTPKPEWADANNFVLIRVSDLQAKFIQPTPPQT